MRAAGLVLVGLVACASSPQPAPQPGGGVIVEGADGGMRKDSGVIVESPPDGGVIQDAARKAGETAGQVVAAGREAVNTVKDAFDAGSPGADISQVKLPEPPPIPPTPAFLGDVQDPPDNPTTPAKVHLGWQLFFDKRMSKSGSMSCESCHHPEKAWTSGEAVDKKDNGKMNTRNAPTMPNLGYHQNGYYWDGRKATLEAVTDAAWTGQLAAVPAEVAARLNAIAVYRAEFQRAFDQDPTPKNIPMALSAFLRALKSGNAPYDKLEQGDSKAASAQVKRGRKVFEETAHCTLCHVPPLYSDTQFHATGAGAAEDHGRMDATKEPTDHGKFKTPSLRDVSLTGPYFHDGSAKTLDEALDFMLAGGKRGAPNLDEKLKPVKLSAKDRAALKAFLVSLTGTATFTQSPPLP